MRNRETVEINCGSDGDRIGRSLNAPLGALIGCFTLRRKRVLKGQVEDWSLVDCNRLRMDNYASTPRSRKELR